MKRLLSLFLMLLLASTASIMHAQMDWDGTVATSFDGGYGTVSSPYRIANAKQFALLLAQKETAGKYFVLTNDIIFSREGSSNRYLSPGSSFDGTLDGQGFYVRGLQSDGLFTTLNGTIKNLGLTAYRCAHCGIASTIASTGAVINCSLSGTLRATDSYDYYASRYVFARANQGRILNSCFNGSLNIQSGYGCTGYLYVGNNQGTISNCYSNAVCNYPALCVISNSSWPGTFTNIFNEADSLNKWVAQNGSNYSAWEGTTNPTLSIFSTTRNNSYTVTFDAAGGNCNEATRTIKNDCTISELPVPNHPEMEFMGWTYDGTVVAADFIVSSNIRLTAKWKREIVSQPTLKHPTVSVKDASHARYNWYCKNDNSVSINLAEISSGTYKWIEDSDMAFTSSNQGINSSSTIAEDSVFVNKGDSLIVDYYVSSENGYDEFIIRWNNTDILAASGNRRAVFKYQFTETGKGKLTFRYHKDSSDASGSDAVTVYSCCINAPDLALTSQTGATLDLSSVNNNKRVFCNVSYTNCDTVLTTPPFMVTKATALDLGINSLAMYKGEHHQLNATISPVEANETLSWISTNTSVATVDSQGNITAVAVGTATITATSTDGSNISATCAVTVTDNHDAAIAALQAIVDRAQALYDNSTEGENIGQYAAGARAQLLAVINSVNARISSTMSDEAITQCTNDINAAIELFQSKKVTAGDDTDISQLDNTIYLERVEAAAGQQIRLSVKMKNTVAIRGYQFDLYLPEGVTVATDEDGFALAELSTARTTKNKTNYFETAATADGGLRVLCGSSKQYDFSGNDGEVAIITLNISQTIEEGEHAIILKNIKLSDAGSTPYPTDYVKSTLVISSYMLGDVNSDGSIDVADFIAIANHILGNTISGFVMKAADVNEDNSIDVADFIGVANMILHQQVAGSRQMTASYRAPQRTPTDISTLDDVIYVEPVIVSPGSQQVLSVKMKNTRDIAGFEFSLQLPEGITIATDADEMNMVELSTERTTTSRTNYFDSSVQADGTLKVLCGTSRENPNTGTLYTFNGNDGEIARITVNIPSDYADGEYAVIVKDAIISDAAAAKTTLQAIVETTLTVGENVLVLDETSTTAPEASNGEVNVLVKRTITANEWSTIVLPFDMTEAQVTAAFGSDVQLAEFIDYEIDDEDNIIINFENYDLSYGLMSNYPYIIKTSKDISEFTTTAEIDPDPDNAIARYDNGRAPTHPRYELYGSFTGVYQANTEVPENCLFISGNKFWYSTGNTKMKAFRGYFWLKDVLPGMEPDGARISFNFNESTGIRDNNRETMTNNHYYDLQGRSVGTPAKKGLYINNGKKMVVK